jgi:hypothetical protein
MGRKKSDTTATEAAPESTTAQAPDNGEPAGAAASPGQENKPENKTEAVQEALRMGIESPTKIAEYVNGKYDMGISVGYVSTIKGNLKKEKDKGGGKRPPGRPPKQKPAEAEGTARSAAKAADSPGGLRPRDVEALADIAERAGGIDHLMQLLTTLKRMR